MNKVIIADAGNAFGKRLTLDMQHLGWEVIAGFADAPPNGLSSGKSFVFAPLEQKTILQAAKTVGDSIDMLVVNLDYQATCTGALFEGMDYEELKTAYSYNTLGALKLVNAFIPLLENGKGKRICFVTTKDSSNYSCTDTGRFADHISRAPLNMAITQLFNELRPKGYTFRAYCKDTAHGQDQWAADFFIRNRSYEPEDLKHSDEQRIVLRDWNAREVPW